MHSWPISTTSETTFQSRSTQHQCGLHIVLRLSSMPEGSGRGSAWIQNPLHAGWTKETQAQLFLTNMEVLNLSYLTLVTQTEGGRVGVLSQLVAARDSEHHLTRQTPALSFALGQK